MSAVSKAELVDHLFNSLGLSKTEGAEIVVALFAGVAAQLEQGKEVTLAGLGKFKLINKKERLGLNPKTKKVARITARRVVAFRAGKKLRNRVIQHAGVNPESKRKK